MEAPNIIYEDENVLAINKPAGLLVHPISQRTILKESQRIVLCEPTLIDWLVEKYPEIKNVGDPSLSSGPLAPNRPGIVHRLDKDTSGVMIVAKNQTAFEYLKNEFKNRKIKKTYLVLVGGKIKEKTGVINLPIGRSRSSPTKRLASLKARGTLREAITEYKVLENFKNYTLIEAYPKTGRTHQIRVHLKAINHPVVCDKIYTKNPICPFGLSRHFLHACSLELTLPDGSRSRFEADLPADLEKVLQELRKEK